MKIDHGLVEGEVPLFCAPLRGCLRCEPDLGSVAETPVLAGFAGPDRWEWSLSDVNGAGYSQLLTQRFVNRVKLLTQVQLTAVLLDACNAGRYRRTLKVHWWETVGRDIEV